MNNRNGQNRPAARKRTVGGSQKATSQPKPPEVAGGEPDVAPA